jgi:hypothetical protein
MSVSGSRAAPDIDLDDFERRLRAAVAPGASVEDPLAELARLVDASWPKASSTVSAAPVVARTPAPAVRTATFAPVPPVVPEPPPAVDFEPSVAPAPEIESAMLRPAFDGSSEGSGDLRDAVADVQLPDEEAYPVYPPGLAVPAPEPRRSRRWLATVSVLAIAGVAMIGAVFALKGGLPGIAKAPPFIAAAVGPTKVQPPSDATVSTSSDAGASLLKDNTQANHVNVVNSEEQPVDLNAQTSQPPAGATGDAGGAVRGMTDAPVVIAAPPPAPAPAPSFPEPKPVRTISLRPDGTPIADAAPAQSPPAQPAAEAPTPPAKAASKAPDESANAQPSTPKIELPTKLSGKSSARVVVGKTDTTAPGGAADAPGEPVQLNGAAAKAGKAKLQEAAAEPTAPAAAEPAQPSSGGWAVQLAAPRSESEAKSVVDKLKGKYASALGDSELGVHKATVNGETIYRVRVTGLAKSDAAALCARIKGDGGQCFVAK